ncbi:MAG TPA: patatin-like phospholipase family protein [Gemmataceae bacterium]|nr:patatin-like phospholipase family protein [Gemmataceae bacterium]
MARADVRGICVCALLAAALPACQSTPERQCNTLAIPVTHIYDPYLRRDTVPVIDVRLCESLAAHAQGVTFPVSTESTQRQFNILVLSGGGAYGAYSAGVLAGWTESGTRPNFDVVTGVSTGALVATLAFLGPERDPLLKRFYTTVTDKDVYARKSELTAIFSDSFRESKPLANLIDAVVDAQLLKEIAAEHAKGRRLYVGTTHLDAKRLVVWDMGAIASRGTPADLALFRTVLLASASIPGFFPPVPIHVDVDGKPVEELHVDGGVTSSLFFRPPQVTRGELHLLGDRPLAGSNIYIIVAGKLFADPACVERRLLPIAADSISALLYSKTRGDLFQLYALALGTGMNYHVTAVPTDLDVPRDSTSFDPAVMGWLYEVGRENAQSGREWRSSPPGTQPGEEVPLRGGTQLRSWPKDQPPRVASAARP